MQTTDQMLQEIVGPSQDQDTIEKNIKRFITESLMFSKIVNQTSACDGASCLMNKMDLHRRMEVKNNNLYWSTFCHRYKEIVAQQAQSSPTPIRTAYVCMAHSDEKRQWQMAGFEPNPSLPLLVHMELCPNRYQQPALMLWLDARRCYLLPTDEESESAYRVHEKDIVRLLQQVQSEGKVVSIQRIPVEHFFSFLLWFHASLRAGSLDAGIQLYNVNEPTLEGHLLYKFHTIDNLFPEEHGQLMETCQDFRCALLFCKQKKVAVQSVRQNYLQNMTGEQFRTIPSSLNRQ